MTIEKSHELIAVQSGLGGGHNHNGVRLILGEVQCERGHLAVDRLIHKFELNAIFGIETGAALSRFGC